MLHRPRIDVQGAVRRRGWALLLAALVAAPAAPAAPALAAPAIPALQGSKSPPASTAPPATGTPSPQGSQGDGAPPQGAGEKQSEPEGEPAVTIRWDQGLRVDALHKSFTLRVGGSAQNDSAAFSANGTVTPDGVIENGVEWRRARVFAEGIFARHFEYKFQYDFAVNSPPNLKDAYLQFNAPVVPLVVRGGRFRTPMGLEGYTSGMDTTFLERGLINTFVPSRNSGVLFISDANRQRHNVRGVVGVVKPEDDVGVGSTDVLGVSGRFTYAFTPREGVLVHAGGDYTHRPVDETVRFLQRPESHIAPQFTDTGDISAASVDTGMVEFAVVRGPLSFQTEAALTSVNREDVEVEDPLFWGGYAYVSWIITGETRPYQEARGNFGRLHPDDPFLGPDGSGYGALELAFRASYLDLNNKGVEGGRMADLTAAFNWYPTRNARVMTNVIRSSASLLEDPVWIAQIRLQWAY